MSEVFADAFYYIALLNPQDQAHDRANQLAGMMTQSVVTTTWVLIEVADALNSPKRRRSVHQFLEGLTTLASTKIIPASQTWYARGMDLYGARPDKSWSLTDCISFEVMREFGLTDALTGDHHFEQAGFQALLRKP